MTHRPRLRFLRRLLLGFGAGIVGGWFAGLLTKPPERSPVRSAATREPVAKGEPDV